MQDALRLRRQADRCSAAAAARASGRSARRCRSRSSRRATDRGRPPRAVPRSVSRRSDSSVSSVSAMPASRASLQSSTSRGVSSRSTRCRCARSKRGCIAESFTEMLGRDFDVRVFADARRSAPMARAIRLEIAVGIGRGQRRLAEHVERVAIAPVGAAQRVVERLLDRAAHDELVAHDAHGLPHRRAHDAARRCGSRRGSSRPAGRGDVVRVEPHDAAGEHQAPGRGVHEQRLAVAEMARPVAGAQLVGDQAVGRVVVRECAAAPRRGT